MLNNEKFGQKVQYYLEKNNITKEKLADYLGLKSARVIYDWINGFKFPTVRHLFNMSKLFNTTMNDMLE